MSDKPGYGGECLREETPGLDLNAVAVGGKCIVPRLTGIGEFKPDQPRGQNLPDLPRDS